MNTYPVNITHEFTQADLASRIFIVVTEVNRIPPHIGIMINGKYFSLTVKGKEIGVQSGVLFKNIMLRKIPSLFLQIKDHPVFSREYLEELMTECVNENDRVEADGTTCLTPVKSFFREGYQLCTANTEFLYKLLPVLEENELVCGAGVFNVDVNATEKKVYLPTYTLQEINERIRQVRLEFK